jgi:hypothetical protein
MPVLRHSRVARAGGIGVALLAAACTTPTPAAPKLDLAPPPDTLQAPFHDAAGAVWLGPGRWALVSEGSGVVGLVDFRGRRIVPLGGPRTPELKNPFALFRAADSLWVADWGLRRLTVWSSDGRFGRTLSAADVTRGALPRMRDVEGRFYVPMPSPPGRDGSGNHDSAAVVRTAPDFSRIDTLVRLAPLDIAEIDADAGRRFERRVFSGADQWGVLPDGSLWVARVYQNRVDWREPSGRWTTGQSLPDRVLEVTRADRELFLRTFPPELRSTAEQLPFAPIKPPFEAGFTSADGLVWLQKSRSVVDSAGSWHVVDRRGHLVGEIRLRGFGRILAAAAGTALAIEPDSAGLRVLQIVVPPLVTQGAS